MIDSFYENVNWENSSYVKIFLFLVVSFVSIIYNSISILKFETRNLIFKNYTYKILLMKIFS